MKIEMRITRELYEHVLNDLIKPHSHAAERIGFLLAKIGSLDNKSILIIFTEYIAVADRDYIYDPEVGARINGTAIRSVMQSILDTKEGAFHIHIHPYLFNGHLGFSKTDIKNIQRLIDSFKVVGPNSAHGAVLFGKGKCTSVVWLPNYDKPLNASRLSIVGYPLSFIGEVL
jgi:hypothetical protein